MVVMKDYHFKQYIGVQSSFSKDCTKSFSRQNCVRVYMKPADR